MMAVLPLRICAAPESTLRDVPANLRALADRIEADILALQGDYPEGVVCRCSVVCRISGREPLVYGYGDTSGVAQTYMDLQAGAQELMNMRHGER